MQEIAGWLDKLGMSEYAQRFAENRIDFSVLPDLTDQDLEKMGVVLGDRRKILRAIAGLDDAEKATQTPCASAEAISAVRPRDAAERRQVTVMFSDLVGSTALSARMDPEDLREVISAYQKCVAETVGRFGGFVVKYMGDEVLVYVPPVQLNVPHTTFWPGACFSDSQLKTTWSPLGSLPAQDPWDCPKPLV